MKQTEASKQPVHHELDLRLDINEVRLSTNSSSDKLNDIFETYNYLRKIRSKNQSALKMGRLIAIKSLDKVADYEELVGETASNLLDLDICDVDNSISVADYIELYQDSDSTCLRLSSVLKNIDEFDMSQLFIFSDGIKLHMVDKGGKLKGSSFDMSILMLDSINTEDTTNAEVLSEIFEELDYYIDNFQSCVKSPDRSTNRRVKGSYCIHALSKIIYSLKTNSTEYLSIDQIKSLLMETLKDSFPAKDYVRKSDIVNEFEKIFSAAMNELNSHLLLEEIMKNEFMVRQGSVDEDQKGGDSILIDSLGNEIYVDWKSDLSARPEKGDGPIERKQIALITKNSHGKTYRLDLIIRACHRENGDQNRVKDKYKFTVQLQNLGKEILFDEVVDWNQLLGSQVNVSIPFAEVVRRIFLQLANQSRGLHLVNIPNRAN